MHTIPVLIVLVLSSAPAQPTGAVAAATRPAPFAQRAIIPSIISGALVAGGVVLLGVSAVQTSDAQHLYAQLAQCPARGSVSECADFEDNGNYLSYKASINRVIGAILMTAGSLGGALTTFLVLFRPASTVSLSLSPVAGGAFVSVGWRLP